MDLKYPQGVLLEKNDGLPKLVDFFKRFEYFVDQNRL